MFPCWCKADFVLPAGARQNAGFPHRPIAPTHRLWHFLREIDARGSAGACTIAAPAPSAPLDGHFAIFHLSFQAFCSFRNLAIPECTGISGLALIPCTCMPTKSRAMGVKPRSDLARLSRFL